MRQDFELERKITAFQKWLHYYLKWSKSELRQRLHQAKLLSANLESTSERLGKRTTPEKSEDESVIIKGMNFLLLRYLSRIETMTLRPCDSGLALRTSSRRSSDSHV